MQKRSLQALARHELEKARSSSAGRSATTVFGGHEKTLRQTLLALRAETVQDERVSPGEATLLVVSGRIRLDAGDTSWEARDDDLLVVPDARHSVTALEDSVVLLTVAKTA